MGLAGATYDPDVDSIDPMVPDIPFPIETLNEAGLHKLASDAVGRDKRFLKV